MAVISLIYKKGKDPLDPGGYRPISLLNNDQKILAKVISNRLSTVIGNIIDKDQTGFIPHCHSSENLRKLVNIQHPVYDSGSPTIAPSLDAAKAFDCVEWEYLFETLRRFGFGENFINWIRTLYDTPYGCILTNGLMSDMFQLHRSTRQGCPLSPGLFIIALEPLAQKLRNHPLIHGVTVGNKQHKLLLYADDMLLVLTQPNISIPALLYCIDTFTLLCWDPQMKMFILGISTGLFLNKHVSHLPQRKLWTELIPHSPSDLYT